MNGAKKFIATTSRRPIANEKSPVLRPGSFVFPYCIQTYQGITMSNSCEP